MQPMDFFRNRIDAMINLKDPLAVLATRLPWNQIEAAVAVQEKAIAHPVDSRLLEIARHKGVSAAKSAGIQLKQTFAKEGKALLWRLRTRQTVPSATARTQTPTHHSWHRHP